MFMYMYLYSYSDQYPFAPSLLSEFFMNEIFPKVYQGKIEELEWGYLVFVGGPLNPAF